MQIRMGVVQLQMHAGRAEMVLQASLWPFYLQLCSVDLQVLVQVRRDNFHAAGHHTYQPQCVSCHLVLLKEAFT